MLLRSVGTICKSRCKYHSFCHSFYSLYFSCMFLNPNIVFQFEFWSLEHFFLTVGQNNCGIETPFPNIISKIELPSIFAVFTDFSLKDVIICNLVFINCFDKILESWIERMQKWNIGSRIIDCWMNYNFSTFISYVFSFG